MWEGREGGEEGVVGRVSEVEKGEASQEEGGEERRGERERDVEMEVEGGAELGGRWSDSNLREVFESCFRRAHTPKKRTIPTFGPHREAIFVFPVPQGRRA